MRLAEASRETWRTSSTEGEGWSQRVGGFTAVPALIRQLGADPISILTELGLASDALDSPERRIPYAAMGAMFQEAARRTECAHFGLLCGRAWHLSDLGLVGEVVGNSPTFAAALRMLTVHQHLNSEGGLAFLLQHGSVVDIGYAIYHPRVVARNQIYDALMAGGCNFMRELCGADWIIGWIIRYGTRMLRGTASLRKKPKPPGTVSCSSRSIGRCACCFFADRFPGTLWRKCWRCIGVL